MLYLLFVMIFIASSLAEFPPCTGNTLCNGEGNLEFLNAQYPSGSILPTVGFGGHKYFFHHSSTVTWIQAGEFCRRFDMNLVSIESEAENNFLVAQVRDLVRKDYMGYWTSGNDLSSNGTYVWNSTGQKFEYQNWHFKEPSFSSNSGLESCVLLYKVNNIWKWNDSVCTHYQYFICELN